ncbi:MAG: ComEA family DNA-binding protein [Proteobacteria bacterium]|nr:ComEA family DNA-binding protein [Pseudomonadota bacterium]
MKILRKSLLFFLFAVASPLAAFAGPVNINTADAATISAELQGVGMSKAQAIVDYRKNHGPFKSLEDLTLVKGIGDRTVEINRANILLKSGEQKRK